MHGAPGAKSAIRDRLAACFAVRFVRSRLVAVRDESKQVPCVRVPDPVPRAARRQDHRLLRQRLCAEELRAEAAEVRALFQTLV